MSDSYKVESISNEEADAFLSRMRKGPEVGSARRSILVPGFEIKGDFFLTARNEKTKEVEWEHSEKNLITDLGRRVWMANRWSGASIGFCPSIDTPQLSRYTLSTDGAQSFDSGNLTPSNASATHTKTFFTTFGVPGINRTLGTIAIGYNAQTTTDANIGLIQLMSFALLVPPKTQTTVQTLEVVYRVSMNPIQ